MSGGGVISVPGPWPVLTVSGNFSICVGETATISATGADSYIWSNNTTGSVAFFSPISSGTYTVEAVNGTSNCKAAALFSIHVSPCLFLKEEGLSQENISLFQDTRAELRIRVTQGSGQNCNEIVFTDVSGRQVLKQQLQWEQNEASVNVESLPAGLYMVTLPQCKSFQTGRVFLQP